MAGSDVGGICGQTFHNAYLKQAVDPLVIRAEKVAKRLAAAPPTPHQVPSSTADGGIDAGVLDAGILDTGAVDAGKDHFVAGADNGLPSLVHGTSTVTKTSTSRRL